jgi:GxxExxY protein
MKLNDVTDQIIGAAIDVHRELGPGLLESTYAARLQFELAGSTLSDVGFGSSARRACP